MPSCESVTEWIEGLKQSDSDAAQGLWDRYLGRLVRLAKKELGPAGRRTADEDVAVAFDRFSQRAKAGRFCRLDDRADLWQLLVVHTERQAENRLRRERATEEPGVALSQQRPFHGPVDVTARESVESREPSPQFAAAAAEQMRRLLGRLGDKLLEEVALAKMQGYFNSEIAERYGISVRSVERKLRIIREVWDVERGG